MSYLHLLVVEIEILLVLVEPNVGDALVIPVDLEVPVTSVFT